MRWTKLLKMAAGAALAIPALGQTWAEAQAPLNRAQNVVQEVPPLPDPRAAAQAPLNWSQNLPGNSKPIILYADDITSWSEKGSRVFLLKGRVWIEHGVVQIQVPQCTIWLDEAQKQRSGIYHVDVFADGEISLHDGPNSFTGLKGHLELNTRG